MKRKFSLIIDSFELEKFLDGLDQDKAIAFLNSEPDLNDLQDSKGYPILHHIIKMDDLDLIRLFLAYAKAHPDKADVQIKDQYGCNLIMEAAYLDNPEPVIRLLLEAGVNPSTESNAQETPLHRLCQTNQIESARMLLERGANPNAIKPHDLNENMENITPAHYAALYGNLEMIKLLASHGASFDIKSRFIYEGEPSEESTAKQIYNNDTDFDRAIAEGEQSSSRADCKDESTSNSNESEAKAEGEKNLGDGDHISKREHAIFEEESQDQEIDKQNLFEEDGASGSWFTSVILDQLISWINYLPELIKNDIENSAPIQSLMESIRQSSAVYDKKGVFFRPVSFDQLGWYASDMVETSDDKVTVSYENSININTTCYNSSYVGYILPTVSVI